MTACILVVDDEASARHLIRAMLTRHDYKVELARNGEEALNILEGRQIDIVITDIAMPVMNGYELLEAIRKMGEISVYFALLQVIFLSARDLDSDIRYAKTLGVSDYLVKPINERDLLAAVSGRLRARQLIKSAIMGDGQINTDELDEYVFTVNNQRVVINCAQHKILVNDQEELATSARAVFLMECLVRKPNKVISITELVRATHDLDTDEVESGNLLRPLVRKVRAEFKRYGIEGCIQNVRGRGYMFVSRLDHELLIAP